MVTKALALWLFTVGVIWALVAAWINLVMSGISTPIVSYWLLLIIYFAAPFILIIGSTLVMARWHSRVGIFMILAACAWLTWEVGPDCVSGLVRPRQPLEAPKPYMILFAILVFLLLADLAAVVLFRRVRKTI
jgi:hypothetical protein